MSGKIAGVCVVLLLITPLLAQAPKAKDADSLMFLQSDLSTAYRAVFAQYLVVRPNEDPRYTVDCAISVSNVCAGPGSVAYLTGRDEAPIRGSVALFLYNSDGTPISYVTDSNSPGTGLNADGTLGAGQTWTVRLAEVLNAAGFKDKAGKAEFNGYGWILSEFDCLAGTYNNTIFGLGFTQNFEMLPAMGQGGFFGGMIVREP